MRDGQSVQDRICAPAHGHIEDEGIVNCVAGDNVARLEPLARQRHGTHAGLPPEPSAGGIHRQDRTVARQPEADRLGQAIHGIGREHARTGAGSGPRRALQFRQGVLVNFPGFERPNTLEHTDQVHGSPIGQFAGGHRPAAGKNRRDIAAQRGHDHARDDFVAVRDADHRVESVRLQHGFDAIGDQVARRQREFHAGMPHGDAVTDADSVKLKRHPARLADGLLDDVRHFAQVDMPWNNVGIGIADGDKRLGHILGLEPGGAQQTAMRRALETCFDLVASHANAPSRRGLAECGARQSYNGARRMEEKRKMIWRLRLKCAAPGESRAG